MKYLTYLVVAVLVAANVADCAAVRSQASRVQTARIRRLDDAEGR